MKAKTTFAPRVSKYPDVHPQTLVDLRNMMEKVQKDRDELREKISRLNDDLASFEFVLQDLEAKYESEAQR